MSDARTQIETIVQELSEKSWVTVSDAIVLRSFLEVSDGEVENVLELLVELQASLQEIETKFQLESKALMGEYMMKVSEVQHTVQRIAINEKETFSEQEESVHQDALLHQLSDI